MSLSIALAEKVGPSSASAARRKSKGCEDGAQGRGASQYLRTALEIISERVEPCFLASRSTLRNNVAGNLTLTMRGGISEPQVEILLHNSIPRGMAGRA